MNVRAAFVAGEGRDYPGFPTELRRVRTARLVVIGVQPRTSRRGSHENSCQTQTCARAQLWSRSIQRRRIEERNGALGGEHGVGKDQQTAVWSVGEGAVQLLIRDLGSHVVF